MAPSPTIIGRAEPAVDAPYATWTGDVIQDPFTATLHNIPLGLLLGNYLAAWVLATGCVAVRMYVRKIIVKDIALDDWVLLCAYVTFVGYIVYNLTLFLLLFTDGYVAEWWDFWRALDFWEASYTVSTVMVRAAIATFFLRLLPKYGYKWQRWCIIVIFIAYTIYMIIFTFINIWQCGDPAAYGYEASLRPCPYTTANVSMPIIARGLTILLDWLMVLVPLVVVVRSNMSRKAKLSVTGILVLASMGSTISILSIVFNNLGSIEYPTDVPNFIIYTVLSLWENAAGLTVVSLAAMRPLFSKWAGSQHSDSSFNPNGLVVGESERSQSAPGGTTTDSAQEDGNHPFGSLGSLFETKLITRVSSWNPSKKE